MCAPGEIDVVEDEGQGSEGAAKEDPSAHGDVLAQHFHTLPRVMFLAVRRVQVIVTITGRSGSAITNLITQNSDCSAAFRCVRSGEEEDHRVGRHPVQVALNQGHGVLRVVLDPERVQSRRVCRLCLWLTNARNTHRTRHTMSTTLHQRESYQCGRGGATQTLSIEEEDRVGSGC